MDFTADVIDAEVLSQVDPDLAAAVLPGPDGLRRRELGAELLARGATVEAGAEIGRTGSGAGATPGLYFEVRIDGRSVDPLQWLKPR